MEVIYMTEKSSYFNEIASTLCAALTAFRDKRVEYYYRVDQKFDNGHQVSVDMEFFYPDEDATGAADRCTCTVKVTLDQVVPGIADLIANEMFTISKNVRMILVSWWFTLANV